MAQAQPTNLRIHFKGWFTISCVEQLCGGTLLFEFLRMVSQVGWFTILSLAMD